MPWRDALLPDAMQRVAIVAPTSRFRRVLAEVASSGRFEPDPARSPAPGPLRTRADRLTDRTSITPQLALQPPSEDLLAADDALLLGEAELEDRLAASSPAGRSSLLAGWIRVADTAPLRTALAPLGGAVAELPRRPGLEAPTAHGDGGGALRPLVTTYATVPARDLDPTLFAAVAYMVMFGMMFGDVAHGAAIVALGLVARFRTTAPPFLRASAPFLVGAGSAAMVFGLLYGEAFGPTGLVPTLWIRPLDEPGTLLVVGLLVGGALLALTFSLAIVNRWREGGPRVALYDPSGVAGGLLLAGLGALAAGLVWSSTAWTWAGVAALAAGAVLVFVGLRARTGTGASGWAQSIVELFDVLLRLGSNVVSFTRLAAFGLTHAVISEVVWDGTTSLWDRGTPAGFGFAVVLFVGGNVAAFALGALVAAIQALRLEYYEMFSRLFATSGRPFTPWHVPLRPSEAS